MGKLSKNILSSISLIIILALIVAAPLYGNIKATAGGSGTAWADRYGFVYTDGLDTWHGLTDAKGKHSGIYEYWEAANPSVNWSISNHAPAWPGSNYYNKSKSYPNAYLNGNGLFIISCHGGQHCLYMWNGSSMSYVYDHWNNCPSNRQSQSIYIASSSFGLDYMKLAFLKGCETSKGDQGHLVWWWRCGKGTDAVIGWDAIIGVCPTNEYMERFFVYAIGQYGTYVSTCDAYAQADVDQMYGVGQGLCWTRELWGRPDTVIGTPGWGVYEGF